jgi:hypothetical protein
VLTALWASLLPPEIVRELGVKKHPAVSLLLRAYPHVRSDKAEERLLKVITYFDAKRRKRSSSRQRRASSG